MKKQSILIQLAHIWNMCGGCGQTLTDSIKGNQ